MRRSHDLETSQKMVRPNSSIVLGYKYLYLCTDVTTYLDLSWVPATAETQHWIGLALECFFIRNKYLSPCTPRLYWDCLPKQNMQAQHCTSENSVANKCLATEWQKGFHRGWMILNCRYWTFIILQLWQNSKYIYIFISVISM